MSNTLLIVTDIFGRCSGFDRLLSDLAELSLHCSVFDPYQGQRQHFLALLQQQLRCVS